MDSTIDSFPFYLSSNACGEIYPDNTASDFKTRLGHPLQLRGTWECGLKSIAYSTKIKDEKETGYVDCILKVQETTDINKIYSYEFITSKNKWHGFVGDQPIKWPSTFEEKVSNIPGILRSLNDLQDIIVKRRNNAKPLFEFATTLVKNQMRVSYRTIDPTFVLRISPKMSKVLGFWPVRQFEGHTTIVATKAPLSNPDISPTAVDEQHNRGRRHRRKRSGSTQPDAGGTKALRDNDDKGRRQLESRMPQVAGADTKVSKEAEKKRTAAYRYMYATDYFIQYFSSNVVKLQWTAYIKKDNESLEPNVADNFCKIWKQEVGRFAPNITAEIVKKKIVLRNNTFNRAVKLSRNLMLALTGGENPLWVWSLKRQCPCLLFGKGDTMEFEIETFSEAKNQKLTNWYVEIYTDDLDKTNQMRTHEISIAVTPWHETNIEGAIQHINAKVKAAITSVLTIDYNASLHAFKLSMVSPSRVELRHGQSITPKLSGNVAALLGLPEFHMNELITHANRDVDKLENHRRKLHVLSNIIQTSSYGEQQRHILRDFLHMGGGSEIVEKEFRPILYRPLLHNTLDMIRIQIVSDNYKTFTISDADTIVVLHFRRVQ